MFLTTSCVFSVRFLLVLQYAKEFTSKAAELLVHRNLGACLLEVLPTLRCQEEMQPHTSCLRSIDSVRALSRIVFFVLFIGVSIMLRTTRSLALTVRSSSSILRINNLVTLSAGRRVGLRLRCASDTTADLSTNAEGKKQGGKGKKKEGDVNASKYSKTVLLPVTSFDQRANSVKREPELQKFWADEKIYERLAETNTGDKFVLHDGRYP